MNKYKAIIFDLDGTLLDSLKDIADAMNYTLEQFNLPTHPYESYNYFVGNGLMNLVTASIPQTNINKKLIEIYFETLINKYRSICFNKTIPYPGIEDLLNQLQSKNIPLAILSNKADELTQLICNQLLNKWNFQVILGASERFPKKPSPEAALFIAKEIQVEPNEILYVGDTNIDMKTAINAGMISIGVTWGFRTKEELVKAKAQFIIDNPLDLLKILDS